MIGGVELDFERCYRAVDSRDQRFDGWFYTGVTSTGIYCRPSCPAMTPKRQNVRFFPSAAAAQSAGLRACRRCRPDASPGSPQWDVRADVVGRAMRLIADGVVDRGRGAGAGRPARLHRTAPAPDAAGRARRRAAGAGPGPTRTDRPYPDRDHRPGPGRDRVRRRVRQRAAVQRHGPRGLRRGPVAAAGTGRRAADRWGGHDHAAAGVPAAAARRRAAGLPRPARAARRGGGPRRDVPPGVAAAARRRRGGADPGGRVRCGHAAPDRPARPGPRGGPLPAPARPGRGPGRRRRRPSPPTPALAPAVAAEPGVRVPRAVDGFEMAVRAIATQQVSLASARTTLTHLLAQLPAHAATLVDQDDRARSCGGFLARRRCWGCRTGRSGCRRRGGRRSGRWRGRSPTAARPRAGRRPGGDGTAAAALPGRRAVDGRLPGDARARRPGRRSSPPTSRYAGAPPPSACPTDPKTLDAYAARWRPWRSYAVIRLWRAA